MLSTLINRQYGHVKGNERVQMDCLLSKLTCHKDDEYVGILSTSNSAASSDLLYACKFSPVSGYEHVLALANEAGAVGLQNTNRIKSGSITSYQAHENAIFDLSWVPKSLKIVTASGDQTAVLWDLSNNSTMEAVSVFRGHSASLKTVDFCPTDPYVFATGSRDGSIMIWDTRSHSSACCKADNVIRNAHSFSSYFEGSMSKSKKRRTPSTSTVNSVTAVLFQYDHILISTGAADRNINVWDLRKNYTAYKGDPLPKSKITYGDANHRSGVTSLCLDPSRTRLYAASMEDIIYEFNVSSYESNPISVYGGHEQHTFYIKTCLSGDGKYLLSGSSDDYAYVWRIGGGPKPLLRLQGHAAEVTCVDWCSTDITKIVTCADDVRHRIWRLNTATEADPDEALYSIKGRAEVFSSNLPVSKPCEQALSRLKEKSNAETGKCYSTPSSVKRTLVVSHKTPEAQGSKNISPRSALSPLPNNTSPPSCHNTRGVSRRLDMNSSEFQSPTRNLPNYVLDGESPHRTARYQVTPKRKSTDWLTDLCRKIMPNKIRKIK